MFRQAGQVLADKSNTIYLHLQAKKLLADYKEWFDIIPNGTPIYDRKMSVISLK